MCVCAVGGGGRGEGGGGRAAQTAVGVCEPINDPRSGGEVSPPPIDLGCLWEGSTWCLPPPSPPPSPPSPPPPLAGAVTLSLSLSLSLYLCIYIYRVIYSLSMRKPYHSSPRRRCTPISCESKSLRPGIMSSSQHTAGPRRTTRSV